MLEKHIAAGPCWPKKMMINRLYDEVEHEASNAAVDPVASAADLLRIKQEQVEAGQAGQARPGGSQDLRAVKREIYERNTAAPSSTFTGPQLLPPGPQLLPPGPPPVPQFSPGLFLSPPPVNLAQFPQSSPAQSSSGSSWQDILDRVRAPSYSNYAPAPAVKPELGSLQHDPAVPSPVFSPVRQRAIVSPPSPGMPLPSIRELFTTREEEKPRIPEEQPVLELAKSASTLNCSRRLCDWTDPHVEECKRRQIQARCERGACNPDDLHALGFKSGGRGALTPCLKLEKNCKPKGPLLKRIIPECVNSGSADTSCKEKPTVSMRLLYRRTSRSIKDPRVGRENYAGNSQQTAAKVLQTQGRGAQWDVNTIVATWSAISMIRVVPGPNPNLLHQDSDHESDIECLD